MPSTSHSDSYVDTCLGHLGRRDKNKMILPVSSGIYTGDKTLHVVAVASDGDLKSWKDFY